MVVDVAGVADARADVVDVRGIVAAAGSVVIIVTDDAGIVVCC